jgi:ATP-dependent DNA ligase
LKGLVSKRSDRPYRGGRSKHWIKIKYRQNPAFDRVEHPVPAIKVDSPGRTEPIRRLVETGLEAGK